MGKLLTIDGLNIVRRVFEANPDPDLAAKADAALRNSLSSFRKLLDTHQPTHVLPAFDAGGHTWRHDLYPRYRENRQPMPIELRERLPAFYEQLAHLGLKVVCIPGVEADDIIATAVHRWTAENRGEVVVASTDKDLLVLISKGASIWNHFKNEWHDAEWVETKFGVTPENMTDLLALMGDATDGIPGISKVGMKTAAKLLRTYGNFEGIMAGAATLKDALGDRLRNERDIAYLSRQLASLKTDVCMGISWNAISTAACRPM